MGAAWPSESAAQRCRPRLTTQWRPEPATAGGPYRTSPKGLRTSRRQRARWVLAAEIRLHEMRPGRVISRMQTARRPCARLHVLKRRRPTRLRLRSCAGLNRSRRPPVGSPPPASPKYARRAGPDHPLLAIPGDGVRGEVVAAPVPPEVSAGRATRRSTGGPRLRLSRRHATRPRRSQPGSLSADRAWSPDAAATRPHPCLVLHLCRVAVCASYTGRTEFGRPKSTARPSTVACATPKLPSTRTASPPIGDCGTWSTNYEQPPEAIELMLADARDTTTEV